LVYTPGSRGVTGDGSDITSSVAVAAGDCVGDGVDCGVTVGPVGDAAAGVSEAVDGAVDGGAPLHAIASSDQSRTSLILGRYPLGTTTNR
jgi:hypothetical protein